MSRQFCSLAQLVRNSQRVCFLREPTPSFDQLSRESIESLLDKRTYHLHPDEQPMHQH